MPGWEAGGVSRAVREGVIVGGRDRGSVEGVGAGAKGVGGLFACVAEFYEAVALEGAGLAVGAI